MEPPICVSFALNLLFASQRFRAKDTQNKGVFYKQRVVGCNPKKWHKPPLLAPKAKREYKMPKDSFKNNFYNLKKST